MYSPTRFFLLVSLIVSASSEYVTETDYVYGNAGPTVVDTVIEGGTTFLQVEIATGTSPAPAAAYTTYVEEEIEASHGGTVVVDVTFTEELVNSIFTTVETVLPTGLSAMGVIMSCTMGVDLAGGCVDKFWISGAPGTSTSSYHLAAPSNVALKTTTVIVPTIISTASAAAAAAVNASSSTSKKNVIGPAVGGVLGGMALMLLCGMFLVRRHNQRAAATRKQRNIVSMSRLSTNPRIATNPFGDSKVYLPQQQQAQAGLQAPQQGVTENPFDSKIHLPEQQQQSAFGLDVKEHV